jgi:hypothetical protein
VQLHAAVLLSILIIDTAGNHRTGVTIMIDDILAAYDWFDHPDGPKFVETHRDEHRTSGHWLFPP